MAFFISFFHCWGFSSISSGDGRLYFWSVFLILQMNNLSSSFEFSISHMSMSFSMDESSLSKVVNKIIAFLSSIVSIGSAPISVYIATAAVRSGRHWNCLQVALYSCSNFFVSNDYMPGFPAHIDTVGQRMYSRYSVELLGTFLILRAVQVLVRHILFVSLYLISLQYLFSRFVITQINNK